MKERLNGTCETIVLRKHPNLGNCSTPQSELTPIYNSWQTENSKGVKNGIKIFQLCSRQQGPFPHKMKLPNGSTLRLRRGASVVSRREVCEHHQNWAYPQKCVWGCQEVQQELKPLRWFSLPVPAVRSSSALLPQGHLRPLQLCSLGSQGHQPGPGTSGQLLLTLDFHVHSLHVSRSSREPGISQSRCTTWISGAQSSPRALWPAGTGCLWPWTNLLSCSYQGAGEVCGHL